LHERDQGKPPRGFGWLSATGKEILKIGIFVERSSLISHLQPHIALGQHGMGDANGFFWNCWDRLGMHGHGFPPGFLDASRSCSVSHISFPSRSGNSPTISVNGG
jgi:hypothetical protein